MWRFGSGSWAPIAVGVLDQKPTRSSLAARRIEKNDDAVRYTRLRYVRATTILLAVEPQELRTVVARNIRALAEARGTTLNSLADFAGVSRAQLYSVLAGDAAPTTDWLAKIAAVLEVEPSKLLAPATTPRQKGR